MKTTRNASDCVGKQPIIVATAMTEHSRILGHSSGNGNYATHATQAIAFGWKPGLHLIRLLNQCTVYYTHHHNFPCRRCYYHLLTDLSAARNNIAAAAAAAAGDVEVLPK